MFFQDLLNSLSTGTNSAAPLSVSCKYQVSSVLYLFKFHHSSKNSVFINRFIICVLNCSAILQSAIVSTSFLRDFVFC